MPDLPSWIEELERLEAAATRGPWALSKWKALEIVANDERMTIVCEVSGAPSNAASVADRDLIAASRNALPTLLRLARLAVEAHYILPSAEIIDGESYPVVEAEDWHARFDALAASTEGKP